jgi:hypothetical protein
MLVILQREAPIDGGCTIHLLPCATHWRGHLSVYRNNPEDVLRELADRFQIFNPVIQEQKFDPDGDYVRRQLPEIASPPNTYLFCPKEAPASLQSEAGIRLGTNYPAPMIDLNQSKDAALAAFKSMKKEHG